MVVTLIKVFQMNSRFRVSRSDSLSTNRFPSALLMPLSFTDIPQCAYSQPFKYCNGVDLSGELHVDDVEGIRSGLLEYGLLVFRNQKNLIPEMEVRFNKLFGWHDAGQNEFLFGFGAPTVEHRVSGGAQLPDWPQVSVLGNVKLGDYYGISDTQLVPALGLTYSGWHADGLHDMFDGMPELTTMFNPMGYQTDSGGTTLFTSGVKAIERMDQELANELEKCLVAYVRCPNDDYPDEARRISPGPTYMVDEGTRRIGFAKDMHNPGLGMHDFELLPEHATNAGRHKCIRVHPLTGQASLYVTPGRAVCLLDAASGEIRHGVDQTAELLSAALMPSTVKEVRYEHQWQQGDFVAWINTLVLHSASDPSDIDGDRLLHRVRLSAPKTRWINGGYTDCNFSEN